MDEDRTQAIKEQITKDQTHPAFVPQEGKCPVVPSNHEAMDEAVRQTRER